MDLTWSTHFWYMSTSLNDHPTFRAYFFIKLVKWIWLVQLSIEIHQCQFEWSFHAYSKCLDQISQMNLTSSTHSCYTSISYNDHITPKAHPFIDLTWWTLFWDISINLNDHLMRKAHSIIKSFSRCIYIDQLISVTLASVCTNHLMSITNTWIKSNQINK